MSENKPQFSFNAQVYSNLYSNQQNEQQPQQINYNSMTPSEKVIAFIKAGDIQNLKNYVENYNNKQSILNDFSSELKQNCIFQSVQFKDEQKAIEMTKFLIDQGASFNSKDIHGQIPLFYVAKDGRINLMKLLLSYQNDVNETDYFNQSCIFYAAREGHHEFVLELILNGANTNLKDKAKQTALFYAIREGKLETCKVLVSNGARMDQPDNRKQTPLDYARKNNQKEIIELLISMGAQDQINEISKKDQQRQRGSNQNRLVKPQKISQKRSTKDQQKFVYKIMISDENLNTRDFTDDDFAKLKAEFPEIAKILLNPEIVAQNSQISQKLEKESWQEIALKIIKNLWKFKGANIFHEPVDPIVLNIPSYFEVVKNPMDFGTIKKKLNLNIYEIPQQFVNDMQQVFINCKLFNGEESFVGLIGVKCREQFQRLLIEFNFESLMQKNDQIQQEIAQMMRLNQQNTNENNLVEKIEPQNNIIQCSVNNQNILQKVDSNIQDIQNSFQQQQQNLNSKQYENNESKINLNAHDQSQQIEGVNKDIHQYKQENFCQQRADPSQNIYELNKKQDQVQNLSDINQQNKEKDYQQQIQTQDFQSSQNQIHNQQNQENQISLQSNQERIENTDHNQNYSNHQQNEALLKKQINEPQKHDLIQNKNQDEAKNNQTLNLDTQITNIQSYQIQESDQQIKQNVNSQIENQILKIQSEQQENKIDQNIQQKLDNQDQKQTQELIRTYKEEKIQDKTNETQIQNNKNEEKIT